MKSRLDDMLSQLNAQLIEMGTLIEYAIENAARALTEKNLTIAREIIAFDHETDRKERDIEAMCLKILLQRQPVAKDLRFISAALKMITDMERISDQAADISEIVTMIGDTPYVKELRHIPLMARATIRMVKTAITAFVERDQEAAEQVIDMDDEVDGLFDTVKNELIDLVRLDAKNSGQAMDLLMIAKYFERIGDHAVNIAEWVIFAITGTHKGEKDV